MSFVFPKPVLTKSRNSSSYSSYSDLDMDDNHYKLTTTSEPDYDELLVRLSLYAFNRLSPSDQQEKVEEISHTVNVEDVQFLEESDEAFRLRTFAELFKKLPFADQLKVFLSKVIRKFKRERQLGELISSFKQLDAEHQQQLIEKVVHSTSENLRNPGETEEEFRLRRFTQLSRDYTHHVHKRLVAWKDTEGQIARRQDMLIEQLAKEIKGVVIEKRLQDESEEDFKLRRFTELCKKVVDFRVQEKFLDNAEKKLEEWGNHESRRMIVEPQDSDSMNSGAELLFHLSTFGFSLLSAKYQQQKIDEMSDQVESGFKTKRRLAAAAPAEDQTGTTDHEEGFRMRRFKELFNQVPVSTRMYIFQELKKILSQEKRYSESIRFFRGLGSEDQTEVIENMFDQIMKSSRWERACDPAEVIVEKFSGENEEDCRLRRFKKMCIEHVSSTRNGDIWPDNMQLHSASDDKEYSPYAKFLFGEAIIWFKARCTDHPRNPIERILFGKVEFGDIIEKLPEESEENFRLRRFTESLKPLQLTSLECIHDYIEERLFYDLDHRHHPIPEFPCARRGLFDPEFVKVRLQGGAATKQVEHAASQP
ncbi:uncharacterized protein LOC133727276 isoform X2 [Rosa rugosa]|uniref:uncharacterized protein LOC133727276 isoform X2 n=1 Tax=Rosa rugosa TaxID=74645 RepID=UPI002B40FC57|nr:uncharacterized protein LOC133727276 isoform X2 [Rosa rugosa]